MNKHYEIMVNNGDYPLIYKCNTISEAYGCLDTLRRGLLHDLCFDMDEIMCLLVEMRDGTTLSVQPHGWSISVNEGEV